MDDRTVDFAKRAIEYLQSELPITANGKSFNIEEMTFVPPTSLNDVNAQLDMKYTKNGSVKGWIKGVIVIRDTRTNKVISKSQGKMNIVPVYCVTDRGTYMVNGSDKVIRSSMRRKPGVYTSYKRNSPDVSADVNFDNSPARISFVYNQVNGTFTVAVNRDKKFDGVGFLRELGFTDQEIVRAMGNDALADSIMSSSTRNVSIESIYEAFFHRKPTADKTTNDIRNDVLGYLADNGKFGANNDTLKQTIGVSAPYMNKEVFLAAIRKLFNVIRQEAEADNPDDLRFKVIKGDNDLLIEQLAHDVQEMKADVIKNLDSDDLNYTRFNSVRKLGKSIDSFMRGDSIDGIAPLVIPASEINPVSAASEDRVISQVGGEGGIKQKENVVEQRNLKGMGFNRIDPVETPESGEVGLVERLSQGAKIEDGTIKVPVYKVFGKEVDANDSNIVYITPTEEYDSKVAYFDSKYVKKKGNKIIFLKNKVSGRYHGKDMMIDVSDLNYVDKAAQNVFAFSANLIPFVNHDDGNRALMGSNMQRQAMDLKNKEVPLVMTSMDGSGTTYEQYIGEKYGKPVRSDVNGTVFNITDSKIIVKDDSGKKHEYPYYKYFATTEGSSINNEVKVKKGDVVKKGQLLAEGWETKDGNLATGVNARTGYLAYKGYNYEDGIVISRSFANKMSADSVINEVVEIRDGYRGGVGSKIRESLKSYTTQASVFTKLDDDGIAKVGEIIKPGDVLVAMLRPAKNNEGINIIFGNKVTQYDYVPYTIPKTSYTEGKIERVYKVDNPSPGIKQAIHFTIVASKPMQLGDKIAGKHGNKGTITKILDDDEMPVAADGVKFDVLFSPLAIPSRKNVGQIYEAGAGLIAEKTGKPFIVNNFDKKEKDRVIKGLKEIGVPDGKMKVTLKEKQPDGSIVEVQTENPVTVGNMYIMRLNKNVDDKLQARSNFEGDASPSDITYMPGKTVGSSAGEKHNPQGIGEMEFRSLQAHGAAYNILESATIKADAGGDIKRRFAIFNALKTGDTSELDMPATPESLKYTQNLLKGLNLNLQPLKRGQKVRSLDEAYDSLSLIPMKGSDFIKVVGKDKEVTKSIPLKANADGTNSPEKGGLFDPKIFGEEGTIDSRNKWGYIKLAIPMPNPVLLKKSNPYATLTGYKKQEINDIVKGKKVMIIDPDLYNGSLVSGKDAAQKRAEYKAHMEAAGLRPGQLISPKELDELSNQYGEILWKAGGESIQYALDQINVNKELKETKKLLDSAESADDINAYYNKYRILDNLKKNKMEASDLMMQYVPVTPTYMRPVLSVGDSVVYSDATKLYGNLIKANNPAKELVSNGSDVISDITAAQSAARMSSSIYKNLENVFGTNSAPAIDTRTGKESKGIINKLTGKTGVVRGSLLHKRVDFSGRSVIGVDPSLGLDEVAIPADMAKYVYRPFIYKELMARGKVGNWDEATEKWSNMDADVKKIMKDIAKDRPVLLNRQPSLHKQSIMAYRPVIKDTQDGDIIRNIQLNPLTVTGFNADFDGDTMSIHVPITDKAKEEAKKLMLPTNNMILDKNGKMTFEIRQEMVMGIYYLTKDYNSPVGDNIDYKSYSALKKDWQNGKIHTNQKVSIDSLHGVPAGYALFILLIPEKYRPVSPQAFDNKKINSIFADMYADCEASNGKDISKVQIAAIMDKVKELGFDASTKSGVSIGVGDFEKVDDVDKLYKNELKANDAVTAGQNVAGIIEGKLKSGEAFKKDDNAVKLIMTSGARGKADQYRKIMGTVGIGGDVTGKPTEPVQSSFVDGLTPSEYYTLGKDSRKGVYDRSVATSAPGAFTRTVYSAVQDTIISEADCHTSDGIMLKNGDPSLVGRTAAENITLKNGETIVKKNGAIYKDLFDKIYKDDSIIEVKVRSPLRCKTVGGVCQKCYGMMPGTTKYPEIGTAVGAIASQSFGEPFTQGTLNTFHSGGAAAFATSGLPRVKQILSLSQDNVTGAVLAPVSGKVTRIEKGLGGTKDIVYINETAVDVPHINGSPLPIRVEVGDDVVKGDFLTRGSAEDIKSGFFSQHKDISPTYGYADKFFGLKKSEIGGEKAREATQDMLLNSLDYAVESALGNHAIDKRHMEVVLGKMTSKVKVTDAGDSQYLKGDTLDKNLVDKWNAENTGYLSTKSVSLMNKSDVVGRIAEDTYKDKAGHIVVNRGDVIDDNKYKSLLGTKITNIKISPQPIRYDNILETINTVPHADNNFFSEMGTDKIVDTISDAAAYGKVDTLSDPRGRIMAGKLPNVGSGFKVPRNIADALTTKIRNLFDNK